jgi:pimeloyl-ACP methyl ester carboxylesterase
MRTSWLAVCLCCLSAIAAAAQDTKIEQGVINGAAFRIEMPVRWNGGLVMYCHGYQPAGMPYDFEGQGARALRAVFLSRGFAFAESAYSTAGWALKEAVEDTEALRRHFVSTHGRSNETIVIGHSMGALSP